VLSGSDVIDGCNGVDALSESSGQHASAVVCALVATVLLVWPVSVGVAAKVLGVSAPKLRRWINEGRFDDTAGLSWVQEGFARQRRLTRNWVATVAKRINAEPDWSAVKGASDE
jgi:hypothetical protein